MKCPKCGHEWPAENQRAGGKARWHGTTKKQRSEVARKAVKARWNDTMKTTKKPTTPVRVQPVVLCERMCDVLGCNKPAACELRIDGDWLPVCAMHAKNRFVPRRKAIHERATDQWERAYHLGAAVALQDARLEVMSAAIVKHSNEKADRSQP